MNPAPQAAGVAVGVTLALMVVAALENTVAPWAPFYVVYALLALALPLVIGGVRLGRISTPRLWHWGAAVALAFALHGVAGLMLATVDLPGMFGAVFGAASARLQRPPEAVAKAYLLFIVIWAGVG